MDAVSLLQQLIAIPSVNPDQAHTPQDPDGGEKRLALVLKQWFLDLGADEVVLDDGGEGVDERPNVYGIWRVPGCARWRAVDVHMDTVSVAHCASDQAFSGRIDGEGRLHGRGACDTKATLALCLSVLSELREGGTALSCNLLLAGTVGEETTKVGAQRFKAWLASRSLVLDELLVAEPTLCQPIHGHKGVCRMQFDLEGLAVHSSQPEQGRNALLAAAAVVQAFQAEHAALQQQQPSPLGPPTLAVTKLSSGVGQNIVPPAATVCIDRRVVIGELAEDVVRQLTALASDHATRAVPGIKVRVTTMVASQPFFTSPDDPLVRQLEQLSALSTTTAPYGTNANCYDANVARACVIMGPGSIDQAHQADEWISVAELHKMQAILRTWLCSA